VNRFITWDNLTALVPQGTQRGQSLRGYISKAA